MRQLARSTLVRSAHAAGPNAEVRTGVSVVRATVIVFFFFFAFGGSYGLPVYDMVFDLRPHRLSDLSPRRTASMYEASIGRTDPQLPVLYPIRHS